MDQALSEIDLGALADAIERRLPELAPVRPLRLLGRGFRSTAVLTPGGAVLRAGRSAEAAENYRKEWRIGPFLAKSLGPIIPSPRWYAEPCVEFPHGALGYVALPGETPRWGTEPGVQFAHGLGAFMAKLHRLPVGGADAAGVPFVDSYRRVLSARSVIRTVLAERLRPEETAPIDAWWKRFARDARMQGSRISVCHHDLWHDNLLRSPAGRLSGVLDLAHVELGDPAHDFAAPRYFGATFMRELIASYREAGGQYDAEDAYRAQQFAEAREFGGRAWALEHDDETEIAHAIEKISRGPIFKQQPSGSALPPYA